jgi:polysaccharide biosynthesis protein PslG
MSQNLPRISGSRGGILVIALVVVIAILVIAGLILPPIALPSRLGLGGGGCKTLSAKNPSLDHPDGLTVAIDPDAKGALSIKLASVPRPEDASDAAVKSALRAVPKSYQVMGPLFQIGACSKTVVPATLTLPVPADAQSLEMLDVLAWDGKTWRWIGGHVDADMNVITARVNEMPQSVVVVETSPVPVTVASDVPTGDVAAQGAELVTLVFSPGLLPADDGGINGDPAALPRLPEGGTAALYPSLRNYTKLGRPNVGLVGDVIADEKLRATHVKAITDMVTKSRFAGVQIDYRGLAEEDRAAFADFVAQLGESLHKANKKLAVVIPTPLPQADNAWDSQGYDWASIGAAADVVQLELPLDPVALGKNSAEALVEWAVGEASRQKLYLGLTSLSVEQAGLDIKLVPFDQALKPFGNLAGPQGTVSPGASVSLTLPGPQDLTFDPVTKVYRYTYTAEGQTGTVILNSGSSLNAQLAWALRYGLRGVTVHGLLEAGNDSGVFTAVQQYAAQAQPTAKSPEIAWTVQGTPVATSPLTRTQFTFTAPTSPGSVSIAAAIAGLPRGQVSMTIGAPAPTPVPAGATDCLKAAFVADVTVPDRTRFDKGAAFVKTWRIRNSGTCDWPADTALTFSSGRKMGAPDSIPVGQVAVGGTQDISANMTSPSEDGNFSGLWRLSAGGKMLTQVSVVIVSGNPPTPTPVAPPSTGPVAPPSSGPTMYGIHAHWGAVYNDEAGQARTADQIAELGLGWTKYQLRWGEEDYFYACDGTVGYDFNHANEIVNIAASRGQRVLFSIVTAPPCTNSLGDVHAPPDDPEVMAFFVGELASWYAGRGIAIEIWNEQNIDREWVSSPQKLDPVRYTRMLAAAYNKIKSIDPSIIVVSGALAPTGFNDGVSAMDDFEYLRQMKAAGADKYMDCVGTHVNALRTPPDASLGGEYDRLFSPPHHSWYFKDTVQGYQSIMGKQACITEFGVASEQGVGSVAGFTWAKDNTEQHQAEWVTQGMKLARDWGARMVILWNLDYGPLSGLNDNALYSFYNLSYVPRPVFGAVKNWCASNGCK